MILQLPSFLDASSDKRVGVWGHGMVEKNLLNLVGDWGGNRVFNWWKNLLNSMRKQGEKTEDSINEKPPKLDEEMRRKTDL